MKKTVISLSLIFLVGCSSHRDEVRGDSITGQVVIKFTEGISDEQKATTLSQFKDVEVVNAKRNIFLIRDASFRGLENEASSRLEKSSGVEFAEPNFIVNLKSEIPQDPYFLKLWGLKNYGQDAPNGIEGTEGADIGALQAWATTKGNRNVRVAVLDTGGCYDHPDLAENVWINEKEKSGIPGVDDDGNGYVDDIHGWDSVSDHRARVYFGQVGDPDPADDNGHGCHVGGTIGAVGGNGIGLVGVNWNVSVAFVKFLSQSGTGSSVDEYRAIQYIIANDFDIVNGSYGGGPPSKLIKSAIEEAGAQGILFVYAAGNNSNNNDSNPTYPSSYDLPNIITVAATDSRDHMADFSNYGQRTVHIAAPGVNILSTAPNLTGKDSNSYAVYSGTSMAAPHVAGAAALLLSADPSLKKKPQQIKERLMNTVDFKPQLSALVSSGGRLNVARAIKNETASNPLASGPWEEMEMLVETPRYPQKKIDNSWEIKVPGAKAIQVHIKFHQVETGFDAAALFDQKFRHAMILTGEGVDTWSPVMLGDTAHLKFSNSMVSIAGGEAFANFNSAGVIIDKVRVLR